MSNVSVKCGEERDEPEKSRVEGKCVAMTDTGRIETEIQRIKRKTEKEREKKTEEKEGKKKKDSRDRGSEGGGNGASDTLDTRRVPNRTKEQELPGAFNKPAVSREPKRYDTHGVQGSGKHQTERDRRSRPQVFLKKVGEEVLRTESQSFAKASCTLHCDGVDKCLLENVKQESVFVRAWNKS